MFGCKLRGCMFCPTAHRFVEIQKAQRAKVAVELETFWVGAIEQVRSLGALRSAHSARRNLTVISYLQQQHSRSSLWHCG